MASSIRREVVVVSVVVPAGRLAVEGDRVARFSPAAISVRRRARARCSRTANATRDHALMLACLRNNLPVVQARGYDDLPDEVLARLANSHVGSLTREVLHDAFAAAMRALLREAADLPQTAPVVARLDALGTT